MSPSAAATPDDIWPASSMGARSTKAIASNVPRACAATARATVVLPIPPGPTSDTSRRCVISTTKASMMSSRPMIREIWAGSRWGFGPGIPALPGAGLDGVA